jgi:coenzyme F420-reducing hydrogenase alpha subunit
MVQIGIAEINKTPSIIDKLDDVAQIVNKKTKDIKGFFIPIEYKDLIEDSIKEIEYRKFLQRNKNLINTKNEDDTILDGLDDAY